MQVILLENIRNLGAIGETVNVKPGYGRNYLIPQGKATQATKENLAVFEARRAELEKKAKEAFEAAQVRAKSFENLTIELKAKASDEGKLFGSVGVKEVADAVTASGNELHKSEVLLPTGPIRELGEFDIGIQLHSDVNTTVKVNIVAEE